MFTSAQEFEQLMPDGRQLLSDEPEMESSLHYAQLALLVSCLELLWQNRQDFFVGANLTIYFSRQQLKNRDFRGPDFFLVKNSTRSARNSWVVWEEEGRYPDLIIELLSDSTAAVDRGIKKQLYQNRFHTSEYFWFSPTTLEFAGFRLGPQGYEPIAPNPQGWLWSQELELFLGIASQELRYFTPAGDLVPTPIEAQGQAMQRLAQQTQRAEQEAQRAEQEAQRAEQEAQRAERLAEQLRSLGIEPDSV
jgi:Uma2 family endonuclease